MMGKLFKHEFKNTARRYWYMYAIILSLTLFCKILDIIQLNVNSKYLNPPLYISVTFLIIGLFFLVLLTGIFSIIRFYREMVGNQAYITYTLPVEVWKHIFVRLTVSIFWIIISVAVCVISGLIMGAGHDFLGNFLKGFSSMLSSIKTTQQVLFIIQLILSIIINTASSLMMFYMSIAIGQLFNRNKAIAAAGAYVGCNMIMEVFTTLLFVLTAKRIPWILDYNDIGFGAEYFNSGAEFVNSVMLLTGLVNILFLVTFFLITERLLSTKLNIE